MKKQLVTCALPYANGPIHIGHLVEYIQADIWVRYRKLRGADIVFFCADDTHGTPIMIRAQDEGIEPTELIERVWTEHVRDFAGFSVEFDNYYSTHSPENRALSVEIYEGLKEGGHISVKEIEQAYCPRDQMFLPDRYIKGTCPNCGAEDQYGDACEVCSQTYNSDELKDPYCAQCRTTPEWRTSEHLFFALDRFAEPLQEWVRGGHVQDEVARKLNEWFETGLKDWDISRDEPYFGFEIPDYPGKYFYVWLDAPVGYMASTMDWCEKNGASFDSYWRSSENSEAYHFIGKDIVYFHALFWPAMLMGSGFRTPDALFVHGFLTVNGEKMSKTRGTFIKAEDYLEYLDPQYLRYYYAAKLNSRVEDIDLSFEDFVRRIDSDLVNKIANIPSRALNIVHKRCGGRIGKLGGEGRELVDGLRARADEVGEQYERREFSQVVRGLCDMAASINGYFQQQEPWKVAAEEPDKAAAICGAALNGYRVLVTLLQPILPRFGERFAATIGVESLTWEGIGEDLEDRPVEPYQRLIERVDAAKIAQLVEVSRDSTAEPVAVEIPQLTLDDLVSSDIRPMRVAAVRALEGEAGYLSLQLEAEDEERNVVARLGDDYSPEDLLGTTLLAVLNLEARKVRGELSDGMILATLVEDRPVLVAVRGLEPLT